MTEIYFPIKPKVFLCKTPVTAANTESNICTTTVNTCKTPKQPQSKAAPKKQLLKL